MSKVSYDFYADDREWECRNGFSIDMDINDKVDITSLEPYGDYIQDMKNIKTLKELKEYIETHMHEVREPDWKTSYTNEKCLEELIEILSEQI